MAIKGGCDLIMGNWEETQAAYFDKEEKVMPERDKMGLVQALTVLHHLRDFLRSEELEPELADALDVIFEWIDNAVLLFHKLAHPDPPEGTEA